MNELDNKGSLFQLNCPYCGEFVNFSSSETLNNTTIMDSNIGEIKINNLFSGTGNNGSYEAVEVEMVCNRCHYAFKTTARRNFDV